MKGMTRGWISGLAAPLAYLLAILLLDRLSAALRDSYGLGLQSVAAGLGIVLLWKHGPIYAPLLVLRPFLPGLCILPGQTDYRIAVIEGGFSAIACGLAAFALRRSSERNRGGDGIRSVLVFLGISSLWTSVSTLAAFVGAAAVQGGAGFLFAQSTHAWLGEILGAVVLAPVLMGASLPPHLGKQGIRAGTGGHSQKRQGSHGKEALQGLETVLQILAIFLCVWLAFAPGSNSGLRHYYICFLPIIWIALRHGFRESALAILAFNSCIFIATCWWGFRPEESFDMPLFALTLSCTGLILGAAVSDRRRAFAQLLKSEERQSRLQRMESLERLVAGIAHGYNNILTVVNGYSSLMLDQLEERHPHRSSTLEIKWAGERAAILTGNLLNFSRRRVVPHVEMDLNAVLKDMENRIRAMSKSRADFALWPFGNPVWIKGNRGQIERAIDNLVTNAMEAMPNGGTLSVGLQWMDLPEKVVCFNGEAGPGSYAILYVSDTGKGMEDGTVSRIFEPFFSTKHPSQSVGLGLSEVFGIVEQAIGRILVDSQPGQGTTVRIFLKAARERAGERGLLSGKSTIAA